MTGIALVRLACNRTIGERLARLHCDLPQGQPAQCLDRRLDVILLADGNAAAGEDQVVVLRCQAQRLNGRLAAVRHHAQISQLATQALQQGPQEEPVGVVDGAGLHLLRRDRTRHHQFVAGGKKRNARTPRHLQPVQPDVRGQTDIGRPQPLALRQHHRAACHVLAGAPDPLAPVWHAVDAHDLLARRRRRRPAPALR